MKAITREWLDRAGDDLSAAELLLTRPELTNMVAFHAQQAVEKTLKAVLEELNIAPIRTHSLTRLYGLIEPQMPISVDQDMLDRLEAVYTQSRYPGELGLLPHGKPTQAEAKSLYRFSRQLCEQIQAALEIDKEDTSTEQEAIPENEE
jgi:HEPN domain-containing protein